MSHGSFTLWEQGFSIFFAPLTLINTRWPTYMNLTRISGDIMDEQISTSCVKTFESYCLTGRHDQNDIPQRFASDQIYTSDLTTSSHFLGTAPELWRHITTFEDMIKFGRAHCCEQQCHHHNSYRSHHNWAQSVHVPHYWTMLLRHTEQISLFRTVTHVVSTCNNTILCACKGFNDTQVDVNYVQFLMTSKAVVKKNHNLS